MSRVGRELDAISAEFRRFEMSMAHQQYSPETIACYRSGLKMLGQYLSVAGVERIQDVTPEVLEGYAFFLAATETPEGTPYSSGAIHQHYASIRLFFKWAKGQKTILSDPAKVLVNPKRSEVIPRRLPSVQEVERILAEPEIDSALGFRDRAVLEVIYAAGLRSREVRFLDLADMDLDAGTLLVRQGKPRKDRHAVLISVTASILKEYINGPRKELIKRHPDEPALFVSQQGKRMSYNQVHRIVRKHATRAGIEKPITPMTLRHTIATHLMSAGLGIRHVQAFLGHRSVETTTIYAKVTPIDLQSQLRKFHPRQKEKQGRRSHRKS